MKKILKALMLFVVMCSLLLIGGVFFIFRLFSANEGVAIVVEEPNVEEFIEMIGETAQELGQANDLYASVMIAQAILESDYGKSGLAAEPYFNLFGIKGTYQNESARFETYEDDGTGNMTKVMANFRKYPSYEDSLQDYAELLRGGLSWDEHYYAPVFKSNTKSYRDATAFLTGTYATDSRYHKKLNRLIEQYDLARYDEMNES